MDKDTLQERERPMVFIECLAAVAKGLVVFSCCESMLRREVGASLFVLERITLFERCRCRNLEVDSLSRIALTWILVDVTAVPLTDVILPTPIVLSQPLNYART